MHNEHASAEFLTMPLNNYAALSKLLNASKYQFSNLNGVEDKYFLREIKMLCHIALKMHTFHM